MYTLRFAYQVYKNISITSAQATAHLLDAAAARTIQIPIEEHMAQSDDIICLIKFSLP